MARKILDTIVVFAFCLFTAETGADQQPEKRVMNFLAVMDLNCGTVLNKENCIALTNVVINAVVNLKKYSVVDRANRDKILAEAHFQQTTCVDERCTIEMGRQLGVGRMVVGSVSKLGNTYLVNLQLLNVETAAVDESATEKCDKCSLEKLIDTVGDVARILMGEYPQNIFEPTFQPTIHFEGSVVSGDETPPEPQLSPPTTTPTPVPEQPENIEEFKVCKRFSIHFPKTQSKVESVTYKVFKREGSEWIETSNDEFAIYMVPDVEIGPDVYMINLKTKEKINFMPDYSAREFKKLQRKGGVVETDCAELKINIIYPKKRKFKF